MKDNLKGLLLVSWAGLGVAGLLTLSSCNKTTSDSSVAETQEEFIDQLVDNNTQELKQYCSNLVKLKSNLTKIYNEELSDSSRDRVRSLFPVGTEFDLRQLRTQSTDIKENINKVLVESCPSSFHEFAKSNKALTKDDKKLLKTIAPKTNSKAFSKTFKKATRLAGQGLIVRDLLQLTYRTNAYMSQEGCSGHATISPEIYNFDSEQATIALKVECNAKVVKVCQDVSIHNPMSANNPVNVQKFVDLGQNSFKNLSLKEKDIACM